MTAIDSKATTRVLTFLEIAGRPTTNEHEAAVALRKARELLDAHGMTFTDLKFGGVSSAPFKSVSSQRKEIEGLRAEAAALHLLLEEERKKKTDAIRAHNDERVEHYATKDALVGAQQIIEKYWKEIESLKILDALKTPAEPIVKIVTVEAEQIDLSAETLKWMPFYQEGFKRFGEKRGWQQWFCNATGHDWGDLTKWRTTDKVPMAAYKKLIELETPVQQPKMTTEERDLYLTKAQEYIRADTLKGGEIADLLSKEFGRTITEGMVKRVKENMRRDGLINF